MSKYLFTTLPTNDLGLPARSLPIAQELRKRGHQVTFCNPAQAPTRLISGAGFDNLLPNRYLLLLTGDVSLKQIARFLIGERMKACGGAVEAARLIEKSLPG